MTNSSNFTKEQLIEQAQAESATMKEMIESGVYSSEVADFYRRKIELNKIALAALTAEPVAWLVYGSKTFKDRTVSTREVAEQAVKDRNDGSSIKPLYTAPQPLTDAERVELQERRKAVEPELKPANLVNKFYERYPVASFKSDTERAAALGYFMAGAELQCFGEFVKYEDLCGDE